MNRDEFRIEYADWLTETSHDDVWGVFTGTGSVAPEKYAVLGHPGRGGFGNVFPAARKKCLTVVTRLL